MTDTESEPTANDDPWKPSVSLGEDSQPIIRVPLELNPNNAGEFNKLVASQFGEKGVETIEFDFSQTQFMDSVTAGLLLSVAKAKPRRISLVLSGLTDERVNEIFASNPNVGRYFEVKKLPPPDQE
jgi:anti-anti-sigma factor